jgi:stage III sporulation protein AE
MNRWLLALTLFLALFCSGGAAAAPSSSAPPAGAGAPGLSPEAVLQQLDLRDLSTVLQQLNQTWRGYGPDVSLQEFLQIYKGGGRPWSLTQIASGLLRYIGRELVANAGLLTKLVVVAILAALLQQIQSGFASDAVGKTAQGLIYLVMMGMAITGFGLAVSIAKGVMDALVSFMLSILPTLLTMLAGMGGVTSAAIFHPLMVTLTSLAATVVLTVYFPLIFLSAILEIVSGLSDGFQLTNLAKLLKDNASKLLTFTFVVFGATVAVKGAAGAVADGLTMKSAKFVFKNFVPVVGSAFADSTDLIFGSTLLLKNALGLLGATAIFFIAAFPLLKILVLGWVYQLAGALVQPIGAGPIAKLLTTMAKSLQSVFAAVAAVALMFLVGITVIVGAANLTLMVR